MLVDDAGAIEGSVTGGCVEGALVDEARAVLEGGPPRVVRDGISDDTAASVGLMCGGTVEIFVHELGEAATEALAEGRRRLAADEPVAVATVLDGESAGAKMAVAEGRTVGTLAGAPRLDEVVARDALGLLDHGQTVVRSYSASGEILSSELRVYVQSFGAPPKMIIFGAIDFSVAVARQARELGYAVTICEARAPFARSPRFAEVAEVVVDWPDRAMEGRELGPRDVALVFTHDPKFDQPALIAALATDAGYIGALGSRRTHGRRLERLREAGVPEEDLARIAAPCGLDIGARTPAETAISILGEVIAAGTGRGGGPLGAGDAPIHPREAEVR
jgi:xanthine dehydrogenase accessory factor